MVRTTGWPHPADTNGIRPAPYRRRVHEVAHPPNRGSAASGQQGPSHRIDVGTGHVPAATPDRGARGRESVDVEDPEIMRSGDGLAPDVRVKLAIDDADVRPDGLERYVKPGGDLLERELRAEQLEDAVLRSRQRLDQPSPVEHVPEPQQPLAENAGVRVGARGRRGPRASSHVAASRSPRSTKISPKATSTRSVR